ncbi:MAG: hypothetical protein AB1491_00030 [Thermodesulfobacteriota bacterium]
MKAEQALRKKLNFVFANGVQVVSLPLVLEGLVRLMHLRVPTIPGSAATATLTLEDEDGYEFYNSGAKAENQNHNLEKELLVAGAMTAKVTLDVAAAGDVTIPAVFWCYGRQD